MKLKVPLRGFQIEHEGRHAILEGDLFDFDVAEDQFRDFDPMLYPSLLLDFVALEPVPDAILSFANRWGALNAAENTDSLGRIAKRVGEDLAEWRTAIEEMNVAMELWAALNRADRWRSLFKLIELELSAVDGLYDISIHLPSYKGEMAWVHPLRVRVGKRPEVARKVLEMLMNAGLADVMHRVELESDRETFTLKSEPSSLHSALWLHFAMLVTRGDSPRICEQCQKLFLIPTAEEPSNETMRKGRSDRRFCDDACRWRHANAKRKTARLSRPATGTAAR